jgi:hypothetical protein
MVSLSRPFRQFFVNSYGTGDRASEDSSMNKNYLR